MSKHTPGPWRYARGKADPTKFRIGNESRVLVLEVSESDVMEEDIKHIVHCVNVHDEMLEALKRAEATLRGIDGNGGCGDCETMESIGETEADFLLSAIAKAEGKNA